VLVNRIKRHYEHLVAYFSPAEVRYRPDEGWSDEQLAVDVFRVFGRSEEVVNLPCQLLYIKSIDHMSELDRHFRTCTAMSHSDKVTKIIPLCLEYPCHMTAKDD
jgi:hypothetical protein